METGLITTIKNKFSTVTTSVLIKSYVGLSMALSLKQKRIIKRRNNFKIRRTMVLNKINSTSNTSYEYSNKTSVAPNP